MVHPLAAAFLVGSEGGEGGGEGAHVGEREGPGVEVALGGVALEIAEHGGLLDGLDALGDDLHVKRVGQRDDGSGDGEGIGVGEAAGDERTVNLEAVDLEAGDVAHVGEAGAEVVDGGGYTKGLDALHHLKGLLGVAHEEAFGDLDLEGFGRKSADGEGALNGLAEVDAVDLVGREVDGHGELVANFALERGDLAACGFEAPGADVDDESALFGDGNEEAGQDEADVGAAPADQGFDTDEGVIDERDLELVDEEESVVREGLAQGGFGVEALERPVSPVRGS